MTGWCWAKQFSFNKYDLSAVSRNQHQANVSYFVSADGISGTNIYIQTLVIRLPFCQKCRAPKQKRSCAKTSKPGKKIDVVTSYASITAVLDQKTKNETVLRLGVPFSCLTRMFQERHHVCSNTRKQNEDQSSDANKTQFYCVLDTSNEFCFRIAEILQIRTGIKCHRPGTVLLSYKLPWVDGNLTCLQKKTDLKILHCSEQFQVAHSSHGRRKVTLISIFT